MFSYDRTCPDYQLLHYVLTASLVAPLAGGWCRHPIGYCCPQNDEVKDHRQQFRDSEEAHHEEEREDSSSHSQHPPPAKWNPPPHHCQRCEDKHQCCAPTEPDTGDGVAARCWDPAQDPAVADRPGPSPPQQPAELPLSPTVQGDEIRSREVRL